MVDTSVASQAGPKQPDQQNGDDQNAQPATTDGSTSSSKLSGPALWVAIFALAVWVAFSIVLLFNVGKTETEWTRIAWVFGSIQSVAFAAAGALFGTAVQQQNSRPLLTRGHVVGLGAARQTHEPAGQTVDLDDSFVRQRHGILL